MEDPLKSLATRTCLRTRNAASDNCYANRNIVNFQAWFGMNPYYDDNDLKSCLSVSGEPNWYKDFGMTPLEACRITQDRVLKNGRMDTAEQQQKVVEMGCDKLVRLDSYYYYYSALSGSLLPFILTRRKYKQ